MPWNPMRGKTARLPSDVIYLPRVRVLRRERESEKRWALLIQGASHTSTVYNYSLLLSLFFFFLLFHNSLLSLAMLIIVLEILVRYRVPRNLCLGRRTSLGMRACVIGPEGRISFGQKIFGNLGSST